MLCVPSSKVILFLYLTIFPLFISSSLPCQLVLVNPNEVLEILILGINSEEAV